MKYKYVLVIHGFYRRFSEVSPSSCLCYSYANSPPLPDDATSRISYRRGRPGTIRVSEYGNSVSPEKTGYLLRLFHIIMYFHYSLFTIASYLILKYLVDCLS